MAPSKDAIGVVLVTLLLAGGCNARSPETTEESAADVETSEAAETTVEAPKPPPRPEPLRTLEGPHTMAFDFLANRPLGHVMRGDAMVFEAGRADFVRYVHGDHPGHWDLEREVDGKKAAALDRRRDSKIWLPALTRDAAQLELEVFNPARGDNNLKVSVNGTKLDPVALGEGWQIVEFDVPSEAMRLENEVDVEFTNLGRIDGDLSGGAFGRIRLGQFEGVGQTEEANNDTDSADETVKVEAAVDAGKPDSASGATAGTDAGAVAKLADSGTEGGTRWLPEGQGEFSLRRGDGVAWYVAGLPKAGIELQIEAPVGCGVQIATAREAADGAAEEPVTSSLRLVDTYGEVQKGAVDYAVPAGEVGRVIIRHEGECDEVVVRSGGIMTPGEPTVRDEIPRPKRIIVWMIDTLRADYLPIHFETDVQAPNLKRLADEGASFKWAYVQGNESRTSHASFFSGMYPSRHRVLGRGHLKPWHELLPEVLQESDYETGAYISNGYVSKPWGFVQGWDYYRNNLRENYGISGEAMAEDGIEWATKHADEDFFLYLGTIDPHVTYRRHKDIIETYDPEPYNGRFERYCLGTDLGKIKGGGIKVTERDKERIIALYKNEITYNDRAFGQLRAALEEKRLWEDTLVVVTSDHGDEFWEHGSVGHGHNVFGELVHVPLILYYPKVIPAGTSLDTGADVLDIYPTILELVGAQSPDDLQGKSLLGLIDGVGGGYPEPSIATQYLLHYALQIGRWKLYLKKGSYQVYDRENDLTELDDVAVKHPFVSRHLLDAAGWFRPNRDRWKKASWGVPSNLSSGFWAEWSSREDGKD